MILILIMMTFKTEESKENIPRHMIEKVVISGQTVNMKTKGRQETEMVIINMTNIGTD